MRRPLPIGASIAEAVLWLRDDVRPVALVGAWAEVDAVLSSAPVFVGEDEDPFGVPDDQPAVIGGDGVVGGGWFGRLGYELGRRIEDLPAGPSPVVPVRPFGWAFHDHVVVRDRDGWWFEALWTPARAATLDERFACWRARLSTHPRPLSPAVPTPFRIAAPGPEGHLAAVAACRERIAAGELFQANLCLRAEAEFSGNPLDLLSRALDATPPRFGAFVDDVLSLSPERFLRRRGRDVRTEPMKGTAPRIGDPDRDRAALDALLASAKDAAEHVMIVDLMRNDLGRVCEYGSIGVEPPRAEPHAGVWQLVSTVSGRLRPEVSDRDLLRATFPPGSVTGAPKVQAMKVIAELEHARRETYTGAIGLASPVAGLDLNVVIRSFEFHADAVWIGAGGGIVADSDPELELLEALTKAAGVVDAIGGSLRRWGAARRPGEGIPKSPPGPPGRADAAVTTVGATASH